MNERIKELAYQAEEYADTIVDQGGEFHEAYTQKLAELIVRECVEICKDTAENQFSQLFQRESDGAVVCYKKIKQHFGVE